MQLELTDADRDYLLTLLSAELGRLKAEINRTEETDFRDELRRREAILKGILSSLDGANRD